MVFSKRLAAINVRVSDEERRALHVAAAKAGSPSVSEFLRNLALGGRGCTQAETPQHARTIGLTEPKSTIETFHVDDLGADPFRLNNGAMSI